MFFSLLSHLCVLFPPPSSALLICLFLHHCASSFFPFPLLFRAVFSNSFPHPPLLFINSFFLFLMPPSPFSRSVSCSVDSLQVFHALGKHLRRLTPSSPFFLLTPPPIFLSHSLISVPLPTQLFLPPFLCSCNFTGPVFLSCLYVPISLVQQENQQGTGDFFEIDFSHFSNFHVMSHV